MSLSETGHESITQSVMAVLAPALEVIAAPIGEKQLQAGLEAALSELAEQVSLNLRTQNLLGSFGEEWAASLTLAGKGSGTGASLVFDAIPAAIGALRVGTHG